MLKRQKCEEQNKRLYEIITKQSKKVVMGQIIGNIAHQWKQPLNAIGSIQTNMQAQLLYNGKIPKKKLLKSIQTSFDIIQYLSDTSNTFYQLLNKKESQESFDLLEQLEVVQKITEYTFANNNIELISTFAINSHHLLSGDGDEFLQALMNIILNAKEAFDNVEVASPKITFKIHERDDNCIITITDNAGGIKITPIEDIFNMDISTKKDSSGLGLFMTKDIIENRFRGSISVLCKEDTTEFTIEVPLA